VGEFVYEVVGSFGYRACNTGTFFCISSGAHMGRYSYVTLYPPNEVELMINCELIVVWNFLGTLPGLSQFKSRELQSKS